MGSVALAILYALFVWWFSTGIVLLLVLRRRRTIVWSLIGAGLLLPASLYVLARSSADGSVFGAYVAFTAAIVLWGTQELAFLCGVASGPRPLACPAGARGFRRAAYAIGAILYHELALIGSGLAVVVETAGAPNQIGTGTFLVLWVMRVSAKLNLFLGVPVLNDEVMPDHLIYLRSYFLRGPMNLFFPVAMTGAFLALAWLVARALASDASLATQTGCVLVSALLALAMIEHGFMLVRLPIDRLWRWSTRGHVQSGLANGRAPVEIHRREQPREFGDIKRVLPTLR